MIPLLAIDAANILNLGIAFLTFAGLLGGAIWSLRKAVKADMETTVKKHIDPVAVVVAGVRNEQIEMNGSLRTHMTDDVTIQTKIATDIAYLQGSAAAATTTATKEALELLRTAAREAAQLVIDTKEKQP